MFWLHTSFLYVNKVKHHLNHLWFLIFVSNSELDFEQTYLKNLPSAESYEKSFMHRDIVTHVQVTKYVTCMINCFAILIFQRFLDLRRYNRQYYVFILFKSKDSTNCMYVPDFNFRSACSFKNSHWCFIFFNANRNLLSRTDFMITSSCDGHVKFWKKKEGEIEFVKHFRAHLGLFCVHYYCVLRFFLF